MLIENDRGFTFIELLIGVMIVAVLSVVSMPHLTNFLRSFRLNGATRIVWGDLHKARQLAIKEGRTISVNFTGTSYTFVRGTAQVVFQRDLTSSYPGVTVSIQNNTISFGSSGTAGGGGRTVEVQSPLGTKRFTILTTGRIGNIS
jgi:type IV fimbrial biogenesis protein FimT